MISQFAIDDLSDLEERGLHPTPRDVVRLNAFALAIESAKGKRPTDDTFLLPRVSILSHSAYFRQPTVGHEIWMDDVLRFCAADSETRLAVRCFALSRDVSALPDATNPDNVRIAIEDYSRRMSDFTRDQLKAAIRYVVYGYEADEGEADPRPNCREASERDILTAETADWDECVAQGILYRGAAVLTGLTLADMKRMTRRQLREVVRRHAFNYDLNFSDGVQDATARYYAVLSEIEERLKAEKEQNG